MGVIGCGIAAHDLHWPALRDMKDKFKIIAVCNHTEPKAKAFSETVGGVPYVLDYKDLLSREDVDAVTIILPFELNRRVTEDALAAGKHVMAEKPLETLSEDLLKMLFTILLSLPWSWIPWRNESWMCTFVIVLNDVPSMMFRLWLWP